MIGCSYTLNSACPSTITTLTTDKNYRRQQRSYSQPPQKHYKAPHEHFFQHRKISKSLESLRENRYKDEEREEHEEEEPRSSRHNAFPPASDLTVRDPAKEFKERYAAEEKNDEGNAIYELAEATRSEENYYDVLNYMKKAEKNKMRRMFPHLQPNNLRPYGSNDNIFYPEVYRKPVKIVYPTTHSTSQTDPRKKNDIQYKEFSSYRQLKEYPGYDESKKAAVADVKSPTDVTKMNYSTTCTKKPRKTGLDTKTSKVTVSTSFTRKSSTALLRKKKREYKRFNAEVVETQMQKLSDFQARRSRDRDLLEYVLNSAEERCRTYNTQNRPATDPCATRPSDKINCDDYVTVKLGQLQDECRKAKKCKPKKISFGRLPKLKPPTCPCIERVPLKEGKPLLRLKRRDVKERHITCLDQVLCDTPRADANYKVVRKTLPPITAKECPCVSKEMTDLIIKRLPKRKIAEPPRVCLECVGEECCPPRADSKLVIQPKVLPPLEINCCPCVEEPPLKDVPLKKLPTVHFKDPERICIEEDACDPTLRADYNLKVKPKVLPILKGDCPCVEPPPMDEGQPFRRLHKIKYIEKPREPCAVCCTDTWRADKHTKTPKKKLPVFVPKNCPCIEEELPNVLVKLKRLKAKPVKEKEKVCPDLEQCGPRADDGMVVKPKVLPQLQVKDCPCVIVEMIDTPPLKKLVPKPVKPAPRVCPDPHACETPRSDAGLKVKSKSLPALPPGNCPCVEPPTPLDVKPLPKLKRKPVTYKRVCPDQEECYPRADENLKVKIKRLPRLEIPDCPCIEAQPPEDVRPLQRLKKVHIPEPCRPCPKINDCDDIPRADADDWLYWKRAEVKPPQCDAPPNKKSGKRSFSTFGTCVGRHYSTSVRRESNFLSLSDVPRLAATTINEKSYNIIIDIKPSAPLILTQKPLALGQKDSMETGLDRKSLRRSKSEPVDCVTFVIFKSNNLGNSKPLKEGSSDVSLVFNKFNRFISTCSTLYEYSERSKDKLKIEQSNTPCECPPNDAYLQPKNPIIPEKENFITPYPTDELIEDTTKKSRLYCRTRKDDQQDSCIDTEAVDVCCKEKEDKDVRKDMEEDEAATATECGDKKMTLWERIVNYFKARPNCPSPEEFKKLRLKEEAETAASKAGLCLYDPKEMLRKTEKELPKVITAEGCKEECSRK